MVYLFCAVLGGGILALICVPLFGKEDSLESAILEETEWDLLQRKKEVILSNIQDLDFEYKCGKLSEGDYQKVRTEMSAEAAGVLAHIDRLETTLDLDALIRREVDVRRGKSPAGNASGCPSCGAKNPPSNRFCAECGAKLNRK